MLFLEYQTRVFKTHLNIAWKLILCCLILTADFAILALSAAAQEKPKAVQVDEFEMANCEEILARTDNFAVKLSNNPNVLAIVIIRYDPASKLVSKARWYRKLITSRFLNYYDISRLKITQDPTAKEIGGQFWLVPPGADEPSHQGTVWPDEPIDLSKPFLYGSYSEDGICNTFTPKQYAGLIKSNSDVRGQIIIHSMFRRYQKETADEWSKTFVEKYYLPRTRFKIFFGKRRDPGYVEFWITPVNKKK